MNRRSAPGVFLRGMMMGAADIVPGVSGGTIAFITGIYDTLLGSIRAVDAVFVGKLARLDIGGAWRHVNGGFLLALLLGIATSIFSLARVISWVLEHYPVPLWAFFFGLILASAGVLLRQVQRWSAPRFGASNRPICSNSPHPCTTPAKSASLTVSSRRHGG